MARNHIPINPIILKWARERAGYSLEQLTGKSGFTKFSEWETGTSFPTYSQLEQIAETFHRPLALFFYPEPPKEESIEKSLRAMSEEDVDRLSPLIRQLFRKAKSFQISLRELWAGDRTIQENRLSWLRTLQNAGVKGLAAQARTLLDVTLEEQQSWQDSEDALKKWRNVLADNGIYVFKDAFRNERVAGFCLYDDLFPIIYINNSLPKNRQIFTVFHELAHIIFQQSYLDVFDQKFWNLEYEDPAHIEVKCNAFAAEFLVPDGDFNKRVQGLNIDDGSISIIADYYHVSREVILRRFLDRRLIDSAFYEQKVAEWQKAFSQKETHTKPTSPGGDFYNSKLSYLGDAYLSLVLRHYSQGRISLEEAASHLDVKIKNFPNIEERFLSRGASSVRI